MISSISFIQVNYLRMFNKFLNGKLKENHNGRKIQRA